MRILHVLPSLSPGGMERLALQLAADATSRGDVVAVAAARGAWDRRAELAGATHVVLPPTARSGARTISTPAAIARLARCIRSFQPHVVHAHNVRAMATARLALACYGRRAALVSTLHGLAPDDYAAASKILRWAAPTVIACAPAVARSLSAAGYPAARIAVIVNGAALEPAGQERIAAVAAAFRIGPRPLVVGVGRLVAQKNWPLFIAAAAHVPAAQFAIAGDGPLLPVLVRMSRRSATPVRFLGIVDDIAALMGLAACVVSTSNWEGLPLALLEALSLGTPVVATVVDGVADVIPSSAALLVAPGDPDAVGAAVARVLSDAKLAHDLRRSAHIAAGMWSPDVMLDQYRAAYRAACDGQAR